jgi:hypothetical protein
VRRFSAAILVALLAVGLTAPAAFAAAPAAAPAKAVPRVVFVVGPAGAATNGYRTQARAAAAIARRYTPDVVELYSPEATWPAVKAALKGASLVVYMGHGNGFPSKYRDELYPPTQNGFGLNPAPGGGDSSHQYFGEAAVGEEVKLAKNAIVLLNHLCYASGNSEPGLPEGTFEQARQRVDNYAAGFIRAGASAVIAEAWSSPSYFVKAILGGGRSIQGAWQTSPSANGHRIAFQSERSPGYVAQMDTETRTSGFTRSIVMKAGLAPKDVLAGARGSAPAAAPVELPLVPLEPTLIGTGLTLGAPDINQVPTAGSSGHVDLLYKISDRKALPKGIQASARWDPIDVANAPVGPTSEAGGTPPAAAAADAATAPAGAPATSDPTSTAAQAAAPAAAGADETSAPAAAGADGSATTKAAPKASPTAATERSGDPSATPKASPAAKPTPKASPAARPTATPDASSAPQAPAPDGLPRVEAPEENLDLVVPEQLGDVVSPAKVKFGKTAMVIPVKMPTQPGRYRLSIWLHDAEGVAYDAATQALVPPLIVRVTGDFDGAIQVAPTAVLAAGAKADLDLRVVNLGRTSWGHIATPTPYNERAVIPPQEAIVSARWVPLSSGAALPTDPNDQAAQTALPIGLAPGKAFNGTIGLKAPTVAGQYMLVLDVVTPERGSLVASGAEPTLVRVTVMAAATK